MIAQYDDALYYNDYIVSGIIDKFRCTGEDSIVVYVPDHGEAVYDEGGFTGHIEENPSRHMIEIPVIIWASDKFKELHPEKWPAIQAAVNKVLEDVPVLKPKQAEQSKGFQQIGAGNSDGNQNQSDELAKIFGNKQ